MAAQSKTIVYVDTMIIFEATQCRCFAMILNHFDVHTVDVVAQEATAGDPRRDDYIEVDKKLLAKTTVHPTNPGMIARATVKSPLMTQIHKGERALLAYIWEAKPTGFYLTSCDHAAVRAACALGFDRYLKSLEEIARAAGASPKVKDWYTSRWLSIAITKYHMDYVR